ncbi:Tar ligand binding domain-containing protein, partial [Salmonella enterica]|uniref:Tar ligand binding domain-containing protein n=1 Tax=Salmonella enterica TaxID=28901 RepID=UPI001D0C59E1
MSVMVSPALSTSTEPVSTRETESSINAFISFALLQLVSGGLLFSSLQHNQQGFVISNELRQQQSELTSTWDL